MSLRSYHVECEAEVDLLEAVDSLAESEREELLAQLLESSSRNDEPTLAERARRLARAIEVGDGNSAAEMIHRLCMDLAGAPVMRELHIGPAPWERAA